VHRMAATVILLVQAGSSDCPVTCERDPASTAWRAVSGGEGGTPSWDLAASDAKPVRPVCQEPTTRCGTLAKSAVHSGQNCMTDVDNR